MSDNYELEKIVLKAAEYLLDYNMCIREISDNLCISAISAYRYINKYLKYIDFDKWCDCRVVLKLHKNVHQYNRDHKGRYKKWRKNR